MIVLQMIGTILIVSFFLGMIGMVLDTVFSFLQTETAHRWISGLFLVPWVAFGLCLLAFVIFGIWEHQS